MRNKIISIILVVCLFCLFSIPCNAYNGYVGQVNCIGDANSDGIINSVDYAIIKAYVLYGDETDMTAFGKWSSDVNLDGIIDGFDATEIEYFINEYGEYVWY